MRTFTFLFLLAILIGAQNCGKTDYRQGKALYTQHCANCHLDHGKGLGILIPPLANSDWLKNNQDQITCVIRRGMEGPVVVNDTTYNQIMPANIELTDFQITNLTNYINHAWGNDYGVARLEDVRKQFESCR